MPIGTYILDFFVPTAKLCIEVDGSAHEANARYAADQVRDAYLLEEGILTFRIPAADLFRNLSVEIETICNLVANRIRN